MTDVLHNVALHKTYSNNCKLGSSLTVAIRNDKYNLFSPRNSLGQRPTFPFYTHDAGSPLRNIPTLFECDVEEDNHSFLFFSTTQ